MTDALAEKLFEEKIEATTLAALVAADDDTSIPKEADDAAELAAADDVTLTPVPKAG